MKSVRIPRGQTGEKKCIFTENARHPDSVFPHFQKIFYKISFFAQFFFKEKI